MVKTEDFSQIIAKAKAKDKEACSTLYNLHYGRLLFICNKICRNNEDAEEAVQDAYFAFFKHLNKIESADNEAVVVAWLKKTAMRVCYRKLKKSRTQDSHEDYADDMYMEIADTDENFLPEACVESKELRENLIEMIDQLPPKQREVIYLYHYADMKTTEIAELKECTDNNIRVTLSHARQSLKRKILENKKFGVATTFVSLSLILHLESEVFAAQMTGSAVALGYKALCAKQFFVAAGTVAGTSAAVVGIAAVTVFVVPAILQMQPNDAPTFIPQANAASDLYEADEQTLSLDFDDEADELEQSEIQQPPPAVAIGDTSDNAPAVAPGATPLSPSADASTAAPITGESAGTDDNTTDTGESTEDWTEEDDMPEMIEEDEEEEIEEEIVEEDCADTRLLSIMATIANAATLAEIEALLREFGFRVTVELRSAQGETQALHVLYGLEQRLHTGLIRRGGYWRLEQALESATAPLMGAAELIAWMGE